jgi:ABC-type branched-subunit amino acid transport system ATPase component/MFS family permease
VPGSGDDTPSLREVVAGRGWYPLGIVTALNLVDELDRAVMVVFAPNIRRYFDISNATLGAIVGVQVALVILIGVPLGYLGTKVDRAVLLRVAAGAWALCAAATSLAVKLPLFIVARLGTGIGKAAVEPVGRSLLADLYPPHAWNRIFAIHTAANPVGNIVGPLLAGAVGLAVAGDGAWRWAFPILAVPTVLVLVASRRLTEVGGREVKTTDGEQLLAAADPNRLDLGAAVGRVLRIPTFYRQTVAVGVLGFALVGLGTFSSILYEDEFGVGEGGRGLILGILATGSLVGALIGGPVGERVFARDPKDAIRLIAGGIVGFSVLVAVAVSMPSIELVVAIQWVALVAVAVAVSPLNTVLSAICTPNLRPLVFSLLGVFVALFGGVLGGVVVGALTDAHGIRIGLASVAPFGIVGGLLMLRSVSTVDGDIEDVARTVREQQALEGRRAAGAVDRALEVRDLDFSYGQVQVLFDVSIDVDDGDVVALLGTNGAGKSTVLRAVCGLDLPDRGSVRCFGEDVTWMDAESRVERGIIQVPGGKSTFPSLTVLENLRTGGYRYRRDKARLDAAVEEVFGHFPVLHDRKDQAAGTLSGGEQQMVALGRAFIADPRLLLIDELSLGLAPVIVEQLLGIVRAFSARGTTLVLVEQSVNVALSIADTAYFMERGQVRFSGPSAELLDRPDLLRSVFLEGAEQSLSTTAPVS